MDLSGIIFVVLAVGWAAYLIPMLLKHHDDRSMSRPVETFSDSVRVVTAARAARTQVGQAAIVDATRTEVSAAVTDDSATEQSVVEQSVVEAPSAVGAAPVVERVENRATHSITRASARRAARRRRRVLAVLLLATVVVGVAGYLAYLPVWSPAVPGALVVAFLVIARLTVRAQQVRRAVPVPSSQTAPAEAVEPVAPSRAAAPAEVEPDLGREDTQGLSRDELAEAVAAPVLDEGGLWDPLPVTLPTYVNKARARRTVRTIEITGITSSGHDPADTELVRTAEEADASAESQAQAEERKAAGA